MPVFRRRILTEVLHSIYRAHDDIGKAQDLVDRIPKRVSKVLGRGNRKKNGAINCRYLIVQRHQTVLRVR